MQNQFCNVLILQVRNCLLFYCRQVCIHFYKLQYLALFGPLFSAENNTFCTTGIQTQRPGWIALTRCLVGKARIIKLKIAKHLTKEEDHYFYRFIGTHYLSSTVLPNHAENNIIDSCFETNLHSANARFEPASPIVNFIPLI